MLVYRWGSEEAVPQHPDQFSEEDGGWWASTLLRPMVAVVFAASVAASAGADDDLAAAPAPDPIEEDWADQPAGWKTSWAWASLQSFAEDEVSPPTVVAEDEPPERVTWRQQPVVEVLSSSNGVVTAATVHFSGTFLESSSTPKQRPQPPPSEDDPLPEQAAVTIVAEEDAPATASWLPTWLSLASSTEEDLSAPISVAYEEDVGSSPALRSWQSTVVPAIEEDVPPQPETVSYEEDGWERQQQRSTWDARVFADDVVVLLPATGFDEEDQGSSPAPARSATGWAAASTAVEDDLPSQAVVAEEDAPEGRAWPQTGSWQQIAFAESDDLLSFVPSEESGEEPKTAWAWRWLQPESQADETLPLLALLEEDRPDAPTTWAQPWQRGGWQQEDDLSVVTAAILEEDQDWYVTWATWWKADLFAERGVDIFSELVPDVGVVIEGGAPSAVIFGGEPSSVVGGGHPSPVVGKGVPS